MTYLEAKKSIESKEPWGIVASCVFYNNKYVFILIDKEDVYDERLGYNALSEFIVDPETGEISSFSSLWELTDKEREKYYNSKQENFVPIDPKTGMYAKIR